MPDPGLPRLNLHAHPTDGADGIAKGIHLRWFFPYKLGFPKNGFRLFRRPSNSKFHVCLDFKGQAAYLKVPFKLTKGTATVGTLSYLKASTDKATVKTIGGRKGLAFPHAFRMKFQRSFHRAEVTLAATGPVTILAKAEDDVVWRYNFRGANINDVHTITIPVSAFTIIEFRSKTGIVWIHKICFWDCHLGSGWKEMENPCGFYLPFHKYAPAVYKKLKPSSCDINEDIIRCRLGNDACHFSGKNLDDLRSILEPLGQDGIKLPVGWAKLQMPGEPLPCETNEKQPSISLSYYDLVLAQSLNPMLARLLGLFWTDANADPDAYYDYKVEADWPREDGTLWKLEHEVVFNEETGRGYFHLFNYIPWDRPIETDNLVFIGDNPRIVGAENSFARVTTGLSFNFPRPQAVDLFFAKPVKETQLFISQRGRNTKVRAIFDDGYQQLSIFNPSTGVVAIHDDRGEPDEDGNLKPPASLTSIQIIGSGVVFHRVHYDYEFIPHGKRYAVVCGIQIKEQEPLKAPENLRAYCLQGGLVSKKDDCTKVNYNYRLGLTWDVPVNETTHLTTDAPVGYHVWRRDPRGNDSLLTPGGPAVVNLENNDDELLKPESIVVNDAGEPERIDERVLYHDPVLEKGTYQYRIQAVDIFGRVSELYPWDAGASRIAEVEARPALPPPPLAVHAKLLDPDDRFLTAEERTWLEASNPQDGLPFYGLHVSWKWPGNLQQQAPLALGFNIHFKRDFFNLIRLRPSSVSGNGTVLTFDDPVPQGIDNEWLRQKNLYRITATGTNSITLDQRPGFVDVSGVARNNLLLRDLVIPVRTPVSQGGAAVAMDDPRNWDALVGRVAITVPTEDSYEVYLSLRDLAFTFPDFTPANGIVSIKFQNAQIGVSTYITEGGGGVSSPSTIQAVYRSQPVVDNPGTTIQTGAGVDINTESATRANVYGKSSYTFRWPAPEDDGVKYFVHRCMDQSLVLQDKQLRESRDPSMYGPVLDMLESIGVPFTPQERADLSDVSLDYSSFPFPRKMLMVLANMPDMIDAFARLNHQPLGKAAPADIEVSYTDGTLEGLGTNVYFYRFRAVDEIGNLSDFSLTSLPVVIPKVTAPPRPSITKINGGDRRIAITWGHLPGITRYWIYRTDDSEKADDYRDMIGDGSPFYVDVVDDDVSYLAFDDSNVVAQVDYYYGVIGVGAGGFRTEMSVVRSARAIDLTPPPPPTIDDIDWGLVVDGEFVSVNELDEVEARGANAIRVAWTLAGDHLQSKVQIMGILDFEDVSEWLPAGVSEFIHRPVKLRGVFQYRIRVRNKVNKENIEFITDSINFL